MTAWNVLQWLHIVGKEVGYPLQLVLDVHLQGMPYDA